MNSNLLTDLPTEIGELANLTEIDLSSNAIKSVPASISRLKKLEYIDLSLNKIKIKSVPSDMKNLIELKQVRVLGNSENMQKNVCKLGTDNLWINASVLKSPKSKHRSPKQRKVNATCAWAEIKGRRSGQEDTLCWAVNIFGDNASYYLGLFDGHAGRKASEYSASNFHKVLMKKIGKNGEEVVTALTDTFKQIHEEIDSNKYPDGTAALVGVIRDSFLYVANAGDSRAVLYSGGEVIPLSVDHKPESTTEKKRILKHGGFVTESRRVCGALTLSRALGDCDLQPWVTWMPDVQIHEISSEDEFIIFACDGLWDVVSNEEAVRIATTEKEPARAATKLRDYAHLLGSGDNISVAVVTLAI
eukprot:TRINITY_DN2820_c0_g3_i1.p1 TRINITY_DN2820_c0_g3~~TRINITY_DN2820_c0_g3_i1.p1  ORF type:complete len:393 (+),score=64.55 TRINITY_DN2820_c0_g3_i1:101-1180(+)